MDAKHFYRIVHDVTTTWEIIQRMPKYEKKFALLLFKTLYEKHPRVLESFHFGEEDTTTEEEEVVTNKKSPVYDIEKDPKVAKHGQRWVQMFSLAIDMLGPDLDVVEEEFLFLGERHTKHNVNSRQYRIMGKVLLETLETFLGKEVFHDEVKESWSNFYYFIYTTMLKGSERQKERPRRQHGLLPQQQQEQHSSSTSSSSSGSPKSSSNKKATFPSSSLSSSHHAHHPTMKRPKIKRSKSDTTDQRQLKLRGAEAALAGYRQKIMERRLSMD